jgi:RimJ/RimL family protein N-acetyltransferase
MKRLDVSQFSPRYAVRELGERDVTAIYDLCRTNPQYYAFSDTALTRDDITRDLTLLPPGKDRCDKYYVGFYEDGRLIALLDLIGDYPVAGCAFIGFFMVTAARSGAGVGTGIIRTLCAALGREGFGAVELCYQTENPQAEHFWRKNGFAVTRETDHQYGRMAVARRTL